MQESNSSPVINTKRRHSAAFKRKLLELIEQPGASVAAVALEHGLNANLVFKWRRAKLERKRSPMAARQPVLLPVSVEHQESFLAVSAPATARPASKESVIEVEIGCARLLLRGSVDPASVRSVLMALRETA
ncbi:IS66-like element accessory protein TnpA [Polaromonas sp. JS666]|uniref:IS66-like element accessory protein TnpA n=1 Tax=Polaromonas sp. (strain JS666 / ATCC BAA-500) TaxID=296591 RepID=UPI0000D5B4BA|nr:transposase [Polaromonas sp. JS666]ABE47387.1 transposase IS3/IS911 [Polaromonas sp. JS666]